MYDQKNTRFTVYYIIICMIALIFIGKLFWMQAIKGSEYLEESQKKQTRSVSIAAPRGQILDRYGRPLVGNREGYSLQIQRTGMAADEFNAVILELYNTIVAYGEEVSSDSLPISNYPFEFTFTGDDEASIKEKELSWKEANEYDEDISAAEVMEKLQSTYKVDEAYSDDDVRKIVGVRYEMQKRGFSVSQPYIIASDVSMDLVTKIKEDQAAFPCVNVASEYVRSYPNGRLATHILGRVGIISADEYEDMKMLGYKFNDYVGKQGMEKYCEAYLNGIDGYSRLVQTSSGFEKQEEGSKDAVPGNNVVLTIDLKLQQALEDALQARIAQIRENGGNPANKSGGDAYCGAGVVLDVNNGDVLAVCSYPDYDQSEFNKNYSKLLADEHKPMWNRALSGAYPPGSTFKMLTSIAALESGIITGDTYINDTGVYKYFKDYQPVCWIWTKNGGSHGPQNVVDAITNSCNYFFYEVGRKMGIETLNEYAKKFGLGEYTGIELSSEEVKGVVAGPEEREEAGGIWNPGDVLQASIGQSDNLFTPLQLANYMATLVNGGIRYTPHLLKSVRSASNGSVIYEQKPVVNSTVELDGENVELVLKGMLGVTEEGSASKPFDDYPVKVGGKTGSAQVARGSDNGVFVAFAPYDDPQIAVAIVIEHGNSGSDVAPVARAVFDEYFLSGSDASGESASYGVLLP